jgi:hypothetical protein
MKASANTDKMGKLFVMLFVFAPVPKTNLLWHLHQDTRNSDPAELK